MDVMIDDQLLADQMNGTVHGGVTLVAGVRYNATSFNGNNGYIDFGRNDGCLTNPGLCTSGITWSMWAYFRSSTYSFFLTSGCGFLAGNTGFSFTIYPSHMNFCARDMSNIWP